MPRGSPALPDRQGTPTPSAAAAPMDIFGYIPLMYPVNKDDINHSFSVVFLYAHPQTGQPTAARPDALV